MRKFLLCSVTQAERLEIQYEELFQPLSTRAAGTQGRTDTNGCREVGLGEGG